MKSLLAKTHVFRKIEKSINDKTAIIMVAAKAASDWRSHAKQFL